MSQGGSIKARSDAIDKELADELKRWNEAKLPGPKAMYRMQEDEFTHHVRLLALERLVCEKLGVSELEHEVAVKEVFLEETKAMFAPAREARSAAIQAQLTNGVIHDNQNI